MRHEGTDIRHAVLHRGLGVEGGGEIVERLRRVEGCVDTLNELGGIERRPHKAVDLAALAVDDEECGERLDGELLHEVLALAFLHVDLDADKLTVEIVATDLLRENLCRHLVAGTAPRGVAVDKQQFLLFLGLLERLLEGHALDKTGAALLCLNGGQGNEEQQEENDFTHRWK